MKFEYCVSSCGDGENQHLEELLNKFGRSGWELVSLDTKIGYLDTKTYRFFFKRAIT